jgi:PEGA domain
MRKYLFLPLVIILGILLASCSDNSTNPTPVAETGSIFINSSPTGATIFVDGTSTTKTTPDSVSGLSTGDHTVKLSLTGYYDTTFTVTVVANQLVQPTTVTLVSTLSTTIFGYPTNIRIYETTGTNSSQPSGLELSTGTPYGVSSSNANKIDLYYYTNSDFTTHEIRSADMYTGLTRQTYFLAGGSTDLADGAPLTSTYPNGGWNQSISDNANSNYYFIYTDDNHYVKFKIVANGGGSGTGDPAYIDVEYVYNNTVNDIRF